MRIDVDVTVAVHDFQRDFAVYVIYIALNFHFQVFPHFLQILVLHFLAVFLYVDAAGRNVTPGRVRERVIAAYPQSAGGRTQRINIFPAGNVGADIRQGHRAVFHFGAVDRHMSIGNEAAAIDRLDFIPYLIRTEPRVLI